MYDIFPSGGPTNGDTIEDENLNTISYSASTGGWSSDKKLQMNQSYIYYSVNTSSVIYTLNQSGPSSVSLKSNLISNLLTSSSLKVPGTITNNNMIIAFGVVESYKGDEISLGYIVAFEKDTNNIHGFANIADFPYGCLLYTSPSPRDEL